MDDRLLHTEYSKVANIWAQILCCLRKNPRPEVELQELAVQARIPLEDIRLYVTELASSHIGMVTINRFFSAGRNYQFIAITAQGVEFLEIGHEAYAEKHPAVVQNITNVATGDITAENVVLGSNSSISQLSGSAINRYEENDIQVLLQTLKGLVSYILFQRLLEDLDSSETVSKEFKSFLAQWWQNNSQSNSPVD